MAVTTIIKVVETRMAAPWVYFGTVLSLIELYWHCHGVVDRKKDKEIEQRGKENGEIVRLLRFEKILILYDCYIVRNNSKGWKEFKGYI